MLRITCFALFLVIASGLKLTASLDNQWKKFKSTYGKQYSAAEEVQRKTIFKQNVKKILSHNLNANLGEFTYTLAINEFADMSHEEFKSKMLGLRLDLFNSTEFQSTPLLSSSAAPESQDWTSYMGPVKNQGPCGSCWAFATTGAIEGLLAIYNNQRVTLSEQNLVDCANKTYNNYGCNGGLPTSAMRYIITNGGIASDTCYPYESRQGTCRYDASCKIATITSYGMVPFGRENILLDIVGTKGPVTIGFDGSQSDFQMYGGGVYSNPQCTTTATHAVVAVGYGTEGGNKYWIAKNSWGSSWGTNGYFKLARGINACGVANLASFPIL